VIHAARRHLEERGVDVIISNQSYAAWERALRTDGFFRGPSNFLLAASKELAALGVPAADMHINRGNGDGPVHL
jgi:ferredoxin-NADP reductase